MYILMFGVILSNGINPGAEQWIPLSYMDIIKRAKQNRMDKIRLLLIISQLNLGLYFLFFILQQSKNFRLLFKYIFSNELYIFSW